MHKNITSTLPFWQACPGSYFKFAGFSAACVTSSFNEPSQSEGWTHVLQCTQRERERQMAQTGVQETRGKTWGFEQRELYETEFIGT